MSTHKINEKFQFADAGLRQSSEGYLIARPRVGRVGIQDYLGAELGLDKQIVKVFRPEEEVFHIDALSSMAHKTVTNDHPSELVTSRNWRKYAVGMMGSEVARDGDFIRVPLMVMDGDAIRGVANGKAELSLGYTCELDFTPGEYNGQTYDAVQRHIRINHVAIVDAARGGKKLRIGDGKSIIIDQQALAQAHAAILDGKINQTEELTDPTETLILGDSEIDCPIGKDGTIYTRALIAGKETADKAGASSLVDALASLLKATKQAKPPTANTGDPIMADKTIVVDGISVTMGDQTAAIVERAMKSLGDTIVSLNKKVEIMTADATKAATDHAAALTEAQKNLTDAQTKVTTLEKQVADAKITPAKLDELVKDRAGVVGKAKAVLDTVVVDGKTDHEIRSQVVAHVMGDAAKGWNEDQVRISFDTLTKDAKVIEDAGQDPYRASIIDGKTQTQDSNNPSKLLQDRDARLTSAWKGQTAAA